MNPYETLGVPKDASQEAIRAAREAAGLTQTQAGALVHAPLRAWQRWEAGDCPMHAGLWELFQRKAGIDGQV